MSFGLYSFSNQISVTIMEIFQLAIYSAICAFVAFGAICQADTEPLQLRFSNAKLPHARAHAGAVYDGQDTIYLIGASNWNLLRYSISSDTLEEFGTFTNVNSGAAILYHQDIIYLGTSRDFEIYRYSTLTHNCTRVNGLPRVLYLMAYAWDPDNELLYLFGGLNGTAIRDEILRYNPRNDAIQEVGQLPESFTGAAAWQDGRALLFHHLSEEVLEYDPMNGVVTKWPPPEITSKMSWPCAVTTGSGQPYAFGGRTWLRYDMANRMVEEVEVNGWNVGSSSSVDSTACVYVNSLDRIYIIGGHGQYAGTTYGPRDEIAYVDLGNPTTDSPVDPTLPNSTTTTDNPIEDCSDGETKFIRNPFCCESFFLCFGGIGTKSSCPDNQHFNPQTSSCDDPEVVRCRMTYDI